MSIIAKRLVTLTAAALFALPVGAGVASALPVGTGGGLAPADHDDNYWYNYYCDRDSHGFNWEYCWEHYHDRYDREHPGHHDRDHRW
ncbi:hypothetical protein [Nocardia sp. CDC160]|uniref:hypothetical protein n=1 Tax=Nocardia sp. CDC160 TaxID=3112166 RepID=UPI002DB9F66C|nr:hypothetical protein [Nocardia sp. CDC160]MEC3919655.1 hypothetical protein [Nocardia sp. CDC160]